MDNLNWVRRDVRVAQARALDLTSKDEDGRPTVHASVYLVRKGALGLLRCAVGNYMVDLDWKDGPDGGDVLEQAGLAKDDGRVTLSPRITQEDVAWLIEGWGK